MAANAFGIDDDNNIWEINPETKATTLIHATGLPKRKGSNGIGYDRASDTIVFFYGGKLYSWKRNSRSTVVEHAITANEANAACYDGAFWYLNGKTLNRIDLDGLKQGRTLNDSDITSYTLEKYDGGRFGDIAITDEGILYGSRTGDKGFFRLDISQITPKQNGSTINVQDNYEKLGSITIDEREGIALQLAISADGNDLYGQSHGNQKIGSRYFRFEKKRMDRSQIR